MVESATVLDNVMCGTYLRYPYTMFDQIVRRRFVARSERAAHDQSVRALDLVGLSALTTSRVDSLPYGARKLVDIARALAGEPTLLLLDEPSSGLDTRERASVLDVLVQLREQKKTTVLVVEHHMDLVRRSATVVIGVQAGSVIRTGSPSDVLDSDDFREAVIGHSHAARPTIEDGKDE
jgi:branched-chain amino acid transport system ATP-binding protein